MEIVQYVQHGGATITPASTDRLRQILPEVKVKAASIDPGRFKHLPEQVLFLADLFEDVADGEYKEVPYVTFAETVFALKYIHRGLDFIPDHLPVIGYADDSSVIRAVLLRHEKALALYAEAKGLKWESISVKP